MVQIDLPPLRERPDDVGLLAGNLLAGLRRQERILGFTDEAADALRRYGWPGNVRELRNVIERAVILCGGDRIGLEHLPPNFARQDAPPDDRGLPSLAQVEEQHIRRVISVTRSLEEAARVLRMDPATLWRRRKKYGI